MKTLYRIHTVGRTHFVQSRPLLWPFWFNRGLRDSYREAKTELEMVKSLDAGIRVVAAETTEETIFAAVELATATIRGELAQAHDRIAELEDKLNIHPYQDMP